MTEEQTDLVKICFDGDMGYFRTRAAAFRENLRPLTLPELLSTYDSMYEPEGERRVSSLYTGTELVFLPKSFCSGLSTTQNYSILIHHNTGLEENSLFSCEQLKKYAKSSLLFDEEHLGHLRRVTTLAVPYEKWISKPECNTVLVTSENIESSPVAVNPIVVAAVGGLKNLANFERLYKDENPAAYRRFNFHVDVSEHVKSNHALGFSLKITYDSHSRTFFQFIVSETSLGVHYAKPSGATRMYCMPVTNTAVSQTEITK